MLTRPTRHLVAGIEERANKRRFVYMRNYVQVAPSALWLTEHVQRDVALSLRALDAVLEVRSVLDEAIEDVEQAWCINSEVRLQQEVELLRLDGEVARNECASLHEKFVSLAQNHRRVHCSARLVRAAVIRDVLHTGHKQAIRECLSQEVACLRSNSEQQLKEHEISLHEQELDLLKRPQEQATSPGGALHSALHSASVPDMVGGAGLDNVTNPATTSSLRGPKQTGIVVLDDNLLLKVFSYLTARGVLASAQVDHVLFSRVDGLFGMGSTFSVMRRHRNFSTVELGEQPKHRAPSIPGSVAAAITAKLSASEIKGIIALDERGRRLESECAALRAENEDLKAALEGTESVKDFLAGKVQEGEVTVKGVLDENAELRRQHHNDYEVINFLDIRNQHLETERRRCAVRGRTKEVQLRRESDVVTSNLAATLHAYEQERLLHQESRRFGKKQRRVLVKEVKSLRLQIGAIRDILLDSRSDSAS